MASFFIFSIVAMIFAFNFRKKSNEKETKKIENNSYDFLIYNNEPSLQDCFERLVNEYKNISGIVPAVSTTNSEMLYDINKSDNPPDIFMIKNFDELKIQSQYGNVLDFINASEKTFQEVVKNIPEILKAKINNINNCGVPLSINGIGWAVNQKVLSNIFGEDSYKSVINDLISCSYEDFQDFAKDINSASSVCLNENVYPIIRSPMLESIFSVPIDFSLSKFLNVVFAKFFENSSDLSNSENISNFSGKFSNWLKMINFVTSKTSMGRGTDFISLDKNSKLKNIKSFAEGKTLFLLSDDSDYDEIKKYDFDYSSNLIFIPIKIPSSSEENKNLNSNISVYCPYYLMINCKSSKTKMAQDFLTWVISSNVARKCLLESNCAMYNTIDPSTIENSLTRSAVNYLQSENSFAPVFQGIKKSWTNSVYQQLIKQYLKSSSWTSTYYDNFDMYCIKKWTY